MIDIEIASDPLAVDLRMPAAKHSLPVARQAVRSLGEALEADVRSLADAELAVAEACANAIVHAYPAGGGTVELSLRPDGRRLQTEVRDQGCGMPWRTAAERGWEDGYGLAVMDCIAGDLRVSPGTPRGTEVAMMLGLGARPGNGTVPPSYALAAERVVRRVTAMFAAQVDLPSDRLVEALLVGELVARLAPRHIAGSHLVLRLDGQRSRLCFRIGPLAAGGGLALLADSEVPVLGSVIERLADDVKIEPAANGDPSHGEDSEQLVVAIVASSSAWDAQPCDRGASPRSGIRGWRSRR